MLIRNQVPIECRSGTLPRRHTNSLLIWYWRWIVQKTFKKTLPCRYWFCTKIYFHRKKTTILIFVHNLPKISHQQAVLFFRNYFFIRIRIPFLSEIWVRFWIRIKLDLQKVLDPVPDPTLKNHSFTIPVPTIIRFFHWFFKHTGR
jgi:hypothetical protein